VAQDNGCDFLIIVIFIAGIYFTGSIWGGVGALAGGWVGSLIFVGVSVGIIVFIIKAISGK
jgi:hypothetical protein